MTEADPDTSSPWPQATIDRLVSRVRAKLSAHDARVLSALLEVQSGGIFALHARTVLVRFCGPREGHRRQTHGTLLRWCYVKGLIRLGSDFGLHAGIAVKAQVVLAALGKQEISEIQRRRTSST